MKILGFNASPLKNGNTAWTISKILEGAAGTSGQTQIRHSSELNISLCKGCLSCVQSDSCVIADDMQGIYADLKRSDALVMGSPVYMGQMNGQAKVFTDRLFAQITPRFSPRFKEENAGKKLILVFTQGNPNPAKFQAYYDYTKSMFQMLEFDVKDVVVVTGTRGEQANERKDLCDTLQSIGKNLFLALQREIS